MVYGSLSAITFLILLKNNALAQCTGRVELLPQCGEFPSTAYIQPVGQVCFPAVIQIPETNNCQNNIAPTQSADDDDDYLNLIFLLISALTGCSKTGNSCARSNSNSNNGKNSNNGYSSNNCAQNTNSNSYSSILSALIPCLCNDSPSSSSGYICDICASNNCPCTNSNQRPASTSYAGKGPNSNNGCTCDICASKNGVPPNTIEISIASPPTSNSPSSSSGCLCDVCANSFPFSSFNPFSALIPSLGNNIPAPSSGCACDSCAKNSSNSPNSNAAPTCIYVPFPIAVPMGLPGFNFNDCYPENAEDGPQEIKLIIQTDCE